MKKISISFALLLLGNIWNSSSAFFQDVDVTHPYYYSIRSLHDKRIVEGYQADDGAYYRPVNQISRAEALKILLLAAQIPINNTEGSIFPDVDTSQWYASYVKTANEEGIVNGFRDGKFYPGAEVSRAQMLKMTLLSFQAEVGREDNYDHWYEPYMQMAEELRIIESEKDPHQQLTRGEVAELIYRTGIVAEKGFTDPYVYNGFGLASYYGGKFHGRSTASGELYDKNDLTAAHRTLPFGTRLKVTYEGKSVIVRVNDRGPYHENRVIDLSEKAFEKLAPISRGVLPISFSVHNLPEESQQNVPEYLREELETESRNPAVPEVVVNHLSNQKNNQPPRPNYIEGTTPFLAESFFPNVTITKPFPQKVYAGDVLYLSGKTKEERAQNVTVFLKSNTSTDNPQADFDFSDSVNGHFFEIPVVFSHPGTYQMGILVDEERRSRVENITVLPRPQNEYFGTGKQISRDQLDVAVDLEKKNVLISIGSKGAENTRIYKLSIRQGLQSYDFRIEGSVKILQLGSEAFDIFKTDSPILFDLYEAPSEDGTLRKQQDSWKKTAATHLSIINGFPDKESEAITLANFSSYRHKLGNYTLKGEKKLSEVTLRDTAYVTQKNKSVHTVPLDFGTGADFSLSLDFDEYGTYVIEIISEEGEILFNRAVYVSENTVLPVKSWGNITGVHASRANMLYWINLIRGYYGEQILIIDEDLSVFAQQYADLMAKKQFISHTDPSGNTFPARLDAFGIKGEYSENLSYGTDLNLALQGLENSGSHLQNMTRPHWKKVGIGFAKTPTGEYYIAHVFGR